MKWSDEVPWEKIPGEFLIRGTEDPPDSAIRVRVEGVAKDHSDDDLLAMTSVTHGMHRGRAYKVVAADDSGFERRSLCDVLGCLWAEPDDKEKPE